MARKNVVGENQWSFPPELWPHGMFKDPAEIPQVRGKNAGKMDCGLDWR